ncbi:MAG: gliding motility lipoprotein GldD [Bacteroidales bacterium]|nr:gliding motility lipoprotein GldD [Bacteroidales bacterium]MBN2819331.1 gliding motility lipoprotein GldD [Bacteroidales bacterium]
MNRGRIVGILFFLLLITSCKSDPVPRPQGYFRIDFPEKKYVRYNTDCPVSFEYPVYAQIEKIKSGEVNSCWYNISVAEYKAKIHLTYRPLNNKLSTYSEDIRSIVYKHTQMADDIQEFRIIDNKRHVFGIIYRISGNTASSLSFYVTDSINHFLSGALYFSAEPNKDSLAPAIKFFAEDVVHLTESVNWE